MFVPMLQLLLMTMKVYASSGEKKQASLLRYIKLGDLNNIKSLICPSEIEPVCTDEQSLTNDSSSEFQHAKTKELHVEPFPASLNNNQALYTAVGCRKAEIIDFFLMLPDVRETAKDTPLDSLKFAKVAAIWGHDDLSLEYSKLFFEIELFELFKASANEYRHRFIKKLLQDDRLDLNKCSEYLMRCVCRWGLKCDAVENFCKYHSIALILVCHEKLKDTEYDRFLLLRWAAENDAPDIFSKVLTSSKFRVTFNHIDKILGERSGRFYGSLMIAHPRAGYVAPLGASTRMKGLMQVKSWFKDCTIDQITSKGAAKMMITDENKYFVLIFQSCYANDQEKLIYLLESGKELLEVPKIPKMKSLFIALVMLGKLDAAWIVMNRSDSWLGSTALICCLDLAINRLIQRKDYRLLGLVYDRLCDGFSEISIKRRMLEDLLHDVTKPGAVQISFNLLNKATSTIETFEAQGYMGVVKVLQCFLSYYALRSAVAESGRVFPAEMSNQILLKLLEVLA